MKVKLIRFLNTDKATVGRLFIDDKYACYTLEDAYQDVKVYGETRIPFGNYEIKLRNFGGTHERYLKRFGNDYHKGMLWLQDVPGFDFILLHIGNTIQDSDGCILVGTGLGEVDGNPSLTESTKAYTHVYFRICQALQNGEKVFINIESYYTNHDKEIIL